jgi:hypothetical protein
VTDRDLGGAGLARSFFLGVVGPLLDRAVPGLAYAAARLGSGSDVLGLDDEMSRDHDWGCRLTLLVDENDRDQVPRISRLLEEELPERYRGHPVRFHVTLGSVGLPPDRSCWPGTRPMSNATCWRRDGSGCAS